GLLRLPAGRRHLLLHRDAGPQGPQDQAHPEGGRREPVSAARGVSVQVRHRRRHHRSDRPAAVRRADAPDRPPVHAGGGRPGVRQGGAGTPCQRARAVHGPAGPLAERGFRGGLSSRTECGSWLSLVLTWVTSRRTVAAVATTANGTAWPRSTRPPLRFAS